MRRDLPHPAETGALQHRRQFRARAWAPAAHGQQVKTEVSLTGRLSAGGIGHGLGQDQCPIGREGPSRGTQNCLCRRTIMVMNDPYQRDQVGPGGQRIAGQVAADGLCSRGQPRLSESRVPARPPTADRRGEDPDAASAPWPWPWPGRFRPRPRRPGPADSGARALEKRARRWAIERARRKPAAQRWKRGEARMRLRRASQRRRRRADTIGAAGSPALSSVTGTSGGLTPQVARVPPARSAGTRRRSGPGGRLHLGRQE